MNLSKKSIAYRLASIPATFSLPSNGLCLFFWQMVLGFVMLLFGVFAGIMCLAVLVVPLFTHIPEVWGISMLLWVLVGWVGIGVTREYARDARFSGKEIPFYLKALWTRKVRERKPTVIGAYVKAVHSKVCPIINFK